MKKNKRIKVPAPAKINLYLEVGEKRNDGYHNVRTVMQNICLFDEVNLSLDDSGIDFDCNFGDNKVACKNSNNIAYRAAVLLKNYLGESRGVKIKIKKHIPVAAGLGGGSSDAASVIKGLLKLWHKRIQLSELKKIAFKLGADVNFFLYGGCCMAENIGEDITPLKPGWIRKPLWVVLANPGFCLSTADVYNNLRTSNTMDTGIIDGVKKLDKHNLGPVMFNRLEEVVFKWYPELEEIKKKFVLSGCIGSLMTGSGPTIFSIFDKQVVAKKAYRDIKKQYPHSWLTKTKDD
jgi:4-diphosphocytidyl-2-C-methyl-D-erythritol kinase